MTETFFLACLYVVVIKHSNLGMKQLIWLILLDLSLLLREVSDGTQGGCLMQTV